MSLSLQETVQALEHKNIHIALDIGVHRYCEIDSNCPIAIELRRLMSEAGVTLIELFEGYEQMEVNRPDRDTIERLPNVTAELNLRIGGHNITLPIEDIAQEQIENAIRSKLDQLDTARRDTEQLASSLYQVYRSAVIEARRSRRLPQLSFDTRALLRHNPTINSDGQLYNLYYPMEYRPEYLYDNGIRYKIADRDVTAITRDAFLLVAIIGTDYVFHQPVVLHDDGTTKLQHYHSSRGGGGDCWGTLRLPQRWDGTIEAVNRIFLEYSRSLKTINMNSLFNQHPPEMPVISAVKSRATELGREGEIPNQAEEVVTTQEQVRPAGWGRGWGRAQRGG